jgi:hypothetical protein
MTTLPLERKCELFSSHSFIGAGTNKFMYQAIQVLDQPIIFGGKTFPGAALPSPGFYPGISGFFKAVGIFLGFLF